MCSGLHRCTALLLLLAFSSAVAPALSKEKNREWQVGRLVSIEPRASKPSSEATSAFFASEANRAWIYTIETEAITYAFSSQSEEPRLLTINSQVRFAFGQRDEAFLLDESGKEFRVILVRVGVKH